MAEYKIMSPFEFYEETKKGREFTLLDVRTPEEFAGARMDYAINIPIDQLEERIKAVLGIEFDYLTTCDSLKEKLYARGYRDLAWF